MTDPDRPDSGQRQPAAGAAVADAGSAGALLRAARQQQGLHIAALAASMKVPPSRLEALEAGRYHELVDTTFTRALAQAMCRALRIDPVPVLALLPGSSPDALGRVDGGLNTPFREHSGRGLPADWAPWRRPVLWLVVLLLLAAAAFVLVPAGALRDVGVPMGEGSPVLPPEGAASAIAGVPLTPAPDGLGAAAPAGTAAATGLGAAPPAASPAQAASGPGPLPGALAPGAAPVMVSGPALVSNPALAASGAAAGSAALQVRALQDTWVQVVDAGNQTLLARVVPAGQSVDLTPAMPARLRIGNVAGTELRLRGQPVDLGAGKRDNILSLSLQ